MPQMVSNSWSQWSLKIEKGKLRYKHRVVVFRTVSPWWTLVNSRRKKTSVAAGFDGLLWTVLELSLAEREGFESSIRFRISSGQPTWISVNHSKSTDSTVARKGVGACLLPPFSMQLLRLANSKTLYLWFFHDSLTPTVLLEVLKFKLADPLKLQKFGKVG